jgi:predicted nucleic acid-binding protein
MHERFTDTSGWAAWAERQEQFHPLALTAVEEVWRQGGCLVTTNWVLAELTALLTRPLRVSKAQQIQLLDDIRGDPGVRLIAVEGVLEAAAWHLWRTRPDKDWTATDCASFVVMQRQGLTEAITADHHFEQAGFIRLLK